LFNPASGTWTNTGAMNVARWLHTATLMANGKVLVAGGSSNGTYLASAEIYDPARGTWTLTSPMPGPHYNHVAALLPNGKVLVAAGQSPADLATADLYDPTTGSWTPAAPLNTARAGATASVLPNGKVLVVGGYNAGALKSAEIYDAKSNIWTFTGSLLAGRSSHAAVPLLDGKVLVAAGLTAIWTNTAEVYEPATGLWTNTGSLNINRDGHTLTLLLNGKVLAAGGYNGGAPLASAEIYDAGLGFSGSSQPQITTIPSPLIISNRLAITGRQFRGVSQTANNAGQASATDFPVVQLRSLENQQSLLLNAASWSTNAFASALVTNFPLGFASATVFANGISSTSSVVLVSAPSPGLVNVGQLSNGLVQVSFNGSPGLSYSVLGTTNLTAPLTNWPVVGGAIDTMATPGQHEFIDSQTLNVPQRFYRVRWP